MAAMPTAKPKPLSATALKSLSKDLGAWQLKNNALRSTYTFGSHREAMAFILRVSYACEQLGHHAEIHNVYSKVTLTLRTHDAGDRVTALDVKLAKKIDSIFP